MTVSNVDVLGRLRTIPGAEHALDVLSREPSVHVVGGAVRDVLLDREPAELDFVVEGDAVDVALRAGAELGAQVVAHDRFGTASLHTEAGTLDLAAARREHYAQPGALPAVELGVPLSEDLARRDFTVNAMAVHVADGELTAWPGALEDLESGVLRVLHDRSFIDDPTRLLRMARYAGRLGFEPDPRTAALAADALAAGALRTVSGSRLGAEVRLAAQEPQPEGLVALADGGLGAAAVHPAFSVDAALVAAALAESPADVRGDLAALAACLLEAPADELAARLDALAFPGQERDTVLAAATRAGPLAQALADPAMARASRLWAHVRHEPAETVALAAALGGTAARAAARRWLRELRHVRLAITGHDLLAEGLSGPAVGQGLAVALAAALDGRASDREEQLAAALAAVGR